MRFDHTGHTLETRFLLLAIHDWARRLELKVCRFVLSGRSKWILRLVLRAAGTATRQVCLDSGLLRVRKRRY